MAITNEKTWQFGTALDPLAHVNFLGLSSSAAETARRSLRFIKDAMISVPINPWEVVGSNDGTTAALDGVDRWDDDSKLLWNTSGVRSWIVLRQSGITSNFQVLFWCDTSSATYYHIMTIVVSPAAGFTGGSTTTRPTATDETVVANRGVWRSDYSTQNTEAVLSVMVSADGNCTRVVQCSQGYACSFMLFDKPKNPEAGWVNPWAATLYCNNPNGGPAASYLTYAALCDAARIVIQIGGVDALCYMATIGLGANPMGQQIWTVNSQLNEWEVYPIWLHSATTGAKGTKGQLYDIWFDTDRPLVVAGDYYTQGGLITHAVFKDLVLPWPNVIPVTQTP